MVVLGLHPLSFWATHGMLKCVGSGLMADAWSSIPWQSLERCNVSSDYEKGYAQFARMVGEENIEHLTARFRSICPDFETEVVSVVGGRIWTRSGLDLKTRSLCSICVLAALGRNNALKLNLQMALRNGTSVEEIYEAIFQVAAYAGFAAAWDALEKLKEVLEDNHENDEAGCDE
jgi:4-carboxymuconolactone decarboxylase